MTDHPQCYPGSEGLSEAEGYAASLRQQAAWIEESPAAEMIDADELRAAANYIDRISGVAQAVPERGALTKIAAECHRAKWQFDFNDENRLPVSQARDMVKRAFGELHRIGDLALKLRDVSPVSSTDCGGGK